MSIFKRNCAARPATGQYGVSVHPSNKVSLTMKYFHRGALVFIQAFLPVAASGPKSRWGQCVAFAMLLFSLSANANYSCTGVVKGVTVSPRGVVSYEMLGALRWNYVCSVNETANGVVPETCRSIYSLLLTAQVTGKKVRIWFRGDGGCDGNSHPGWKWLTDWYWGPELLEP